MFSPNQRFALRGFITWPVCNCQWVLVVWRLGWDPVGPYDWDPVIAQNCLNNLAGLTFEWFAKAVWDPMACLVVRWGPIGPYGLQQCKCKEFSCNSSVAKIAKHKFQKLIATS